MNTEHLKSEPGEPLEGEIVEASLARPVEEPSGNGAVDAVFDLTGRLLAPVVRVGWRGARGLGRGLGINGALDRAADRVLESEPAEQVVDRVLESDAAMRIWERVLESQEAQLLVERVADAPEVRSAITSQGVGLLEDARRTARRAARRLDDTADRFARRLLRRRPRAARPVYAGAVTRLLAITLDALILNSILLVVSAVVAALINNVLNPIFDPSDETKYAGLALGLTAWLIAAGFYLAGFWTLAERTPGMSFFGLRIFTESGGRVPPGKDLRRLFGFYLAVITFGIGFLGVLTGERRRGWPDRLGQTIVLYADPEIDPGVDESGHLESLGAPPSTG